MDTHRIQDMHLLLSEPLRLSVEMALAGHFSAHCPQDVQAEPAIGIIPAPAFLYGLLPGIDGLEKSLEDAFSRTCSPNFVRTLQSSKSGLPAAHSCMMECSATSEMAERTRNPAC